MGITDLAIHNVLRTYSKQDRLGKLQRPRQAAPVTGDKLDLSAKAQKFAVIAKASEEIVTNRFPTLSGEARQEMIRRNTQNLLEEFSGELEDKGVTPENLQERVQASLKQK